jgi:hypothetical protein
MSRLTKIRSYQNTTTPFPRWERALVRGNHTFRAWRNVKPSRMPVNATRVPIIVPAYYPGMILTLETFISHRTGKPYMWWTYTHPIDTEALPDWYFMGDPPTQYGVFVGEYLWDIFSDLTEAFKCTRGNRLAESLERDNLTGLITVRDRITGQTMTDPGIPTTPAPTTPAPTTPASSDDYTSQLVEVFGMRYTVCTFADGSSYAGYGERIPPATHFDIILAGDDGDDDAWRIMREGREDWDRYDSEDAAIDAAFLPFAHGGYPLVYTGDGEWYCAACTRDMWRTDAESRDAIRTGQISSGSVLDEPSASGESCGHCQQYIPGCEPHCSDCMTDLDDERCSSPVFHHDNGERILCAACMARLVHTGLRIEYDLIPESSTHAVKTGLQRYTVYDGYLGGDYRG